ncbi:hypothetical protein GCM10022259_23270 [Aquimarina mytili]
MGVGDRTIIDLFTTENHSRNRVVFHFQLIYLNNESIHNTTLLAELNRIVENIEILGKEVTT